MSGGATLRQRWHHGCSQYCRQGRTVPPYAAAAGGGTFRAGTTRRSGAGRAEQMDEDTFQKRLAELVAEIGTLPPNEREKLQTLAEQTKQRHKELRETVSS